MLDLAETLNPLLDRRKERLDAGEEDDEDTADTTLQLVFFDGEEAFKDWTATDSIYGARCVLCDLPFRASSDCEPVDILRRSGQQPISSRMPNGDYSLILLQLNSPPSSTSSCLTCWVPLVL